MDPLFELERLAALARQDLAPEVNLSKKIMRELPSQDWISFRALWLGAVASSIAALIAVAIAIPVLYSVSDPVEAWFNIVPREILWMII